MKKMFAMFAMVMFAAFCFVGAGSAQQPKQPKLKLVNPATSGRVIEPGSVEDQEVARKISEFDNLTKTTGDRKQKNPPSTMPTSAVIVADESASIYNYQKTLIFLTTASVPGDTILVFYQTPRYGNTRTYRAINFQGGLGQGFGFILQNGGYSSFESDGPMLYEVYIITGSRTERIATVVPVFSEEVPKTPQIDFVTEQPLGNDDYIVSLNGNFSSFNDRPTIVVGCCTVVPDVDILGVSSNQIRFRMSGANTYFPGGKNLITVGQGGVSDSMTGRHRRVY